MATAPRDRLNQLFSNESLPNPPKPGQPHFSEKELHEKAAQDKEAQKMPSTARHLPKADPLPETTRSSDILTSSDDDDDYVAAFKKKPSMKLPTKQTKPKPSDTPDPNAFGYPKSSSVQANGPIEYFPKGKTSTNPKTTSDKPEHSEPDDDHLPTSSTTGQPVNGHFCQFNLVSKFPYKYMNDSHNRVSIHFFANNKFYDRPWDIYYLNPPYTLSAKPIFLVPYEQVQQLITEIGETFKIPVSVPLFPFTLTFYDDGTPQPKLLGTSRSRSEAGDLQSAIDSCPVDHGECPEDATPEIKQQYADFRAKCEAALTGNRRKGPRSKKKREDDRLFTVGDGYSQLKRGQRYLGLRPKSGQMQPVDPNLSWDEQEIFLLQQQKKAHLVLDPLDLDKPVPHRFENEPIFIAVDIEAYERAHNLITEIGVSTLDSLDLAKIPPGRGGRNWIDQIRSRHFRIKGREHLVNKDFCIGNPDEFQFGKSEFVGLNEAAAKVDGCFEWPFSVQYKHSGLTDPWDDAQSPPGVEHTVGETASAAFGGVSHGPTNAEQDSANRAAVASVLKGIGNQAAIKHATDLARLADAAAEKAQLGSRDRSIVFIGHDVRSDLDYLKTLGSKIFSSSRATYPIPAMDMLGTGEGHAKVLTSILEAMDTASIFKALKGESQARKLSYIMEEMGRVCYFPHNGGNDARYTLEAFVAMMVKARLDVDEAQKKSDEKAKQLVQANPDDSWNQPTKGDADVSDGAAQEGETCANGQAYEVVEKNSY